MEDQEEVVSNDQIESGGEVSTESVEPQNEEVSQPVQESQPQQFENSDTPKAEYKNRAERRIDQLTAKLKGSNPAGYQAYQNIFPDEPLIRQEEYEVGVEPQVLEQRFNAKLNQAKQQWFQEADARITLRETISSHESDVLSVAEKVKDDPEFEQRLTDLYQKENTVYNPLTGQYEFNPQVKMSEIYQREVAFLTSRMTKAQANVQAQMQDLSGQQAVPVSGKSESSPNYDEQVLFEEAKATGDWSQLLKKRMFG